MSSRLPPDTDSGSATLPTDPHQRLVLFHVLQNGGAITLAELSRRIADSDGDAPTELRNSAVRRRVYDSLSTVNLPALIDRGLLEYEDGVIVATPALEELVEQRVAADDDDDGRWFRRFAAAAVLLACLVLAASVGLLPAKEPLFGVLTLLGVLALFILPPSKHLGGSTSSHEK